MTGWNQEQLASDVRALSQLATAVCFAPCVDRPEDPRAREQADELLWYARELKADLDVFLDDEVRVYLVQLIEHFDENRGHYRASALRWIDLLEEIAFNAESRWGDGAGVLKQREVRAAIYYLVSNFFGPQELTTVPPWMRPIVLEVITRITVEFLVTLDNLPDRDLALWQHARSGPRPKVRFKAARVRWAEYRQSFGERLVGRLVRIFMPRPYISPAMKARVDPILADWAERNRITGTTPVRRLVEPFVFTARWIGTHGTQVRAAIEAVSKAVYLSAALSRMEREERLEVVKHAVLIMFEDLGYTGPLFRAMVRFMVDLSADATENLFRKRGIV